MRGTVKLGEILKTGAGGTPLKSKKEFYEGGTISWLLSGAVCEKEINNSETFITQAGLENSSAKLFPPNTVLVAMYGATAGQVGILKVEASTNQAVCGIYPNEKYLPEFLYYFLLSYKEKLLKQASGAAQPNLSQIKIKNIPLPIIPVAQQQSIVAKLDAAFAEIDKAQAIDERKDSELKSLRQSTLQAMLSQVLASKKLVSLSDVCEKVSVGHVGTTSKYYCDDGIPFLRTQNVGKEGFDDTEVRYITQDFHRSLKKSQLQGGDVLLSRVVIDEMRAAIVPNSYGEANCANVILIRPKKELLSEFLAVLIKSPSAQLYFMGVKKGAAQQVVNTGILKKWQIPLPSIEQQAEIVELTTQLAEKLNSITQISKIRQSNFKQLRTAILVEELGSPTS